MMTPLTLMCTLCLEIWLGPDHRCPPTPAETERVLLEKVATAASAWIRNPGHKRSYTLERAVDALERFREAS